jgi:hypothetical protein
MFCNDFDTSGRGPADVIASREDIDERRVDDFIMQRRAEVHGMTETRRGTNRGFCTIDGENQRAWRTTITRGAADISMDSDGRMMMCARVMGRSDAVKEEHRGWEISEPII